jgi:hypothetical protein
MARPGIGSNRYSNLIHRLPKLGTLVHPRDQTVFICIAIVEQNPGTELRVSSHKSLSNTFQTDEAPSCCLFQIFITVPFCTLAALLKKARALSLRSGEPIRIRNGSLVQDDSQKRLVDFDHAVVFDEAHFLNLVINKFTRERLVPTISASVSSLTNATKVTPSAEWHRMRGPIAETTLSDRFLSCILARNNRVEADLIDQLFNSTEKRLARTLLLLARYGGKDQPEAVDPQVYLEFAGVLRRVVEFRNERDSHLFNC